MSVHTENLNDPNTVARLSTHGSDEGGIKHLWQVANRGVPHNPILGQDLIETFILTLIACRREYFNRDLVRSVLDLPDLVADYAAYGYSIIPTSHRCPQQARSIVPMTTCVKLVQGTSRRGSASGCSILVMNAHLS